MKKFLSVLKIVFVVLLALTVLVAAGFAVRDFMKNRASEPSYTASREQVFEAVETAVKSDMGKTKTITFCPKEEQTVSQDGNTYTVSGYVDTTDAKDKVTRTNYTVKLTLVGNNNFLLESCNLF